MTYRTICGGIHIDLEEFSEKYQKAIDEYCQESVDSLAKFMGNIQSEDIEKMSRESVIMLKMIWAFLDKFYSSPLQDKTASITLAANHTLAENAEHLPDLFTRFKKMQQEKMMGKMLGEGND